MTVLTSLKFENLVELGIIPDRKFLNEIGIFPPEDWKLPEDGDTQQGIINEIVLRWANIAIKSGVDIVLSSPLELSILVEKFNNVGLISPGIRPPWSPPDH